MNENEMPEIDLVIKNPPIRGRMRYRISSEFTIDRDEYWNMSDEERQALHDKHDPGSKAMVFDVRFAEKHGRKL